MGIGYKEFCSATMSHFSVTPPWPRKTQKDPELLTEKQTVLFVDYVGKAVSSKSILGRDIMAMDKTAVWLHMVSPTTTDTQGAKSVALKTLGYEKSHLTVILAAKADGTKLRPYIVFRWAVSEVKGIQQQISSAVITTSVNGLATVHGRKIQLHPALLLWDSYHCHITATTKAELKCGYNITGRSWEAAVNISKPPM